MLKKTLKDEETNMDILIANVQKVHMRIPKTENRFCCTLNLFWFFEHPFVSRCIFFFVVVSERGPIDILPNKLFACSILIDLCLCTDTQKTNYVISTSINSKSFFSPFVLFCSMF